MEALHVIAGILSVIFFAVAAYGLSVVVHELAHALAARCCGIAIYRINLGWLKASCELGFTKETEHLWNRPGIRLFIGSAGIIATALLAIAFLLLCLATPAGSWASTILILCGTVTLAMTLWELLPGADPGQDLFVCLQAIEELRGTAKAPNASN